MCGPGEATYDRHSGRTGGTTMCHAKVTNRTLSLAVGLCGFLISTPLAVPEPPQRAERVLVRFKATADAATRRAAHQAAGAARTLYTYRIVSGLECVEFKQSTVNSAIAAYHGDPAVLYAEPDYDVHAVVLPDDERFEQLWGLHNTGQEIEGFVGTAGSDIRAVEAWDIWTGDPDFRVAVIDTGVDYTHADLAANIWTNPGEIPDNNLDDDGNGWVDDIHGYDFVNDDGDPLDDYAHGTHVAGTIGAVGNNGLGVTGVNWQCSIVGLKFLDSTGSGSTADAILALQYVLDNDIKLSNNSWGGGPGSQALRDAIEATQAIGHIFVAAAGNKASNIDDRPFFPASFNLSNIISVAATDGSDNLASFSSWGAASVDLGAPGVKILSTVVEGIVGTEYSFFQGTSMATPHVTGVVGLMWSQVPSLHWMDVRDRLLDATRPVASLSGLTVTGGIVSAVGVLDCNLNGVEDAIDIAEGTSEDCSGNGIPDECERDCNENGSADSCDILDGTSGDCNENRRPDECETDCNLNSVADECEITDGTGADCNFNDYLDECDLADGASPDWDGNGVPDECECDPGAPERELLATDIDPGDFFGGAVAMDGQRLVVGAPLDSDLGFWAGSAWVFRRAAGGASHNLQDDTWVLEAKLTAPDMHVDSQFGISVCIHDDLIGVGARSDAPVDAGVRQGAAYVFRLDRGGTSDDPSDDHWVDAAKLWAEDATGGDQFGVSIACHGDRIAVGAPYHGEVRTDGAVYVFRRDASGTPGDPTDDVWLQEAKFMSSEGYTKFGMAVALGQDVLMVGAPSQLAVYVYRLDGQDTPNDPTDDTWIKLPRLDGRPLGDFGFSVALDGGQAVVGAPDKRYRKSSGAARVFGRDDSGTPSDPSDDTWSETATLAPRDGDFEDLFGHSVAVGGDVAAVASPGHDAFGTNQGAIYLYRRDDQGTPENPPDDTWFEYDKLVVPISVMPGISEPAEYLAMEHGLLAVGAPNSWRSEAPGQVFVYSPTDDCNHNGVSDRCEVDCNSNGLLDACDLATNVSFDCNANDLPDECDIAADPSLDEDGNGFIDGCCLTSTIAVGDPLGPRNRFLSFAAGDPGQSQAIRVSFDSLPPPFDVLNGETMWVGEPVKVCENSGQGLETQAPGGCGPAGALSRNWFCAAPLVRGEGDAHFMDWHGQCDFGICSGGLNPGGMCSVDEDCLDVVQVYHEGLIPGGTFAIQVVAEECSFQIESSYSAPLAIDTSRWGDLVGTCAVIPCTPPDGVVNIATDVTACVDKFRNLPNAVLKSRADIEPQVPDLLINISDVTYVLDAFRGFGYPFVPSYSSSGR